MWMQLNLVHLPGIERSHVQSGINLDVMAQGREYNLHGFLTGKSGNIFPLPAEQLSQGSPRGDALEVVVYRRSCLPLHH